MSRTGGRSVAAALLLGWALTGGAVGAPDPGASRTPPPAVQASSPTPPPAVQASSPTPPPPVQASSPTPPPAVQASSPTPPPAVQASSPTPPPPVQASSPTPPPAVQASSPTPGRPAASPATAPEGTPTPGAAQPQPDPPRPVLALDFREAIRLALNSSPDLEEQRARIREAQANLDLAGVPGRPTLGFDATYTHILPEQSIDFGGRTSTLVAPDNYNLAVTLRQAILTFGRLEWGTLAAELTERSAREEYRARLERLMAGTADLYLLALQAGEQVVIFQQQLQAREASLRDAEILFRAGTVARFDVLRAASEVSNARQELLQAENRVRLVEAQLATAMGIPASTDLVLTPVGTETAPPTVVEPARQRALQRRPEIRTLQWAIEASRARVGYEASQDSPTLALQSQATKKNATGFTAQGEQWNTSVVLSVPFFDGGYSRARTDAAREVVKQLESRLESSRREVSLDVERAWLDLHTRWQRIEVSRQFLAQAEEAARVARVRYKAGLSTSIELLDAETSLTRARQDLANARFLYLAAGVAWNRATSEEYPVEVPGPLPPSAPGGLPMEPAGRGTPNVLDPGGNSPQSPATEDPRVPVILPASSAPEAKEGL